MSCLCVCICNIFAAFASFISDVMVLCSVADYQCCGVVVVVVML